LLIVICFGFRISCFGFTSRLRGTGTIGNRAVGDVNQDTSGNRAGDSAHRRILEQWPDPSPISDNLAQVERFDDALLHQSLRPWIADVAERIQCPADFPAVAAMDADESWRSELT